MNFGFIMQGGPGWPGGAEYIRNAAQAVAAVATECPLTVLHDTTLDPSWLRGFPDRTRFIPLALHHGRIRRWLTGGNRPVERTLQREGVTFFYPLTYENFWNIGVTFPIPTLFGGSRWAGWIPDFQHRHMPELFSETDRALRDSGIVALGKSAHEIVFSSATAADDFARFYPDAKAAARVVHFHTAANPAWYTGDPEAVRTKYSVPSRYFIVCNQFWLHKNHGIILDALDLLAKDGVSPHVICTGSTKDYRSPNYFSDLQRRAETLTLTNRFQVLGLVDRFDQIQLIRGALAVIQPSKSEGWSTVVEDARVLGKRVLLSSIPVHCEQNPPGAEFFEPDDAHRLAELLRRAWREWQPGPDPGGEAAAREAGERAQHEFGERMLALATAAHP